MHIKIFKCSALLISLMISALGFATTTVDSGANSNPPTEEAIGLPHTGMSMQQVDSLFGEPAEKLDSVGKPPITTWRYADFNVYFENQRVLHSVRFVPYVRPMQIIVE